MDLEIADVWLIDNSRMQTEALRALLTDYRITAFQDGATALERLAQQAPPDVILVDWEMPGLNGLEICRFVRERYDEATLPLLMLTSHRERADIREALAAGANDFVSKPYDDHELLARVRTLVLVRQQSKARIRDLSAIFEQAPGLIAHLKGPELIFDLANANHRAMAGGRALLGEPLDRALPTGRAIGDDVARVFASGERLTASEVPLSANGGGSDASERIFDFLYQPTRDAAGTVDGVFVHGVDVTAAVRARQRIEVAEAAVRESQEWLRAVLVSIGDGVIATDAGGNVTFMNAVAEDLTGWSQADASGQPVGVPFQIIQQESRAPQRNPLHDALREGRVVGLANHTVLVARDGRERVIDDSAAPIRNAAGQVVGAVIVFRDVTEKARVERERRQRNRELELGAIIGRALAAPVSLEDQLRRCAQSLVHGLDAALARIWILAPESDTLVLRASAGMYTHLDGAHSRIAVGQLTIGQIAAERSALVTNDVVHDLQSVDLEWAAREELVSFAGHPLLVGDRLLGVLALFARHPFDVSSVALIDSVAAQLSGGIERGLLERERERLLRETEAQRSMLSELFAQAPVAIAVLSGPEYVIEVANPHVLRMWGRSHAQIHGRPLFAALPEIAEQGLEALLDGVRSTGRPYVGRERLVRVARAEGGGIEDVYFDFVYQPMQGIGGPSDNVLVIANDVTEDVLARREVEALTAALREREERLRLAVEATGVGIWEIDLATNAVYGDDSLRAVLGLPAGTPLDVASGFERMIPADRERIRRALADATEGRNDGRLHVVHRSVRPSDGAERWIELRGQATRGEDGRAARLLGTIIDVTERVTADAVREQLVATQRAALEAAQRQHEFEQYLVGIVSHDLRSPIQAISMGAHLLMRNRDAEDNVTRQATRIRNSAERAARMIRDVLDFTQARLGGGFQIKSEPVDLSDTVHDAIDEARIGWPQRVLDLTTEGDTRGSWDRDRILQVVTNLITNAIKYSPDDSRVTLSVRGEGARVELRVHNFGPPIPSYALSQIFTPMRREATDQTMRSVGLGLFIVDSIVRAHTGEVHVESTAEAGTTFTVTLPRAPTEPRP